MLSCTYYQIIHFEVIIPTMEVVYVNNNNTLEKVCARLAQAPTIAVDTEFLREKTYYAQLCLIQLCGNDLIACIDPLELDNIDVALDLIYDPAIKKIIHSGRQDLEVFFDIKQCLPSNVFDTQLAATFLGQGEQIGYAALVEKVVGVSLAKTETRTDWSRRPLNERQLEYAADDVRYLHAIYDDQIEKLNITQRMKWLNDELQALTDITLFDKPKQWLWQRVKAWQQLNGQDLAVLQTLAILREEYAVDKNRPRRWILSDPDLLSLAKNQPETAKQLSEIISEKLAGQYADSILTAIAAAKVIPQEQWPKAKGRYDFSSAQMSLIKQVMALIRKKAEEFGITAPLIASRKEIEAMIAGRHFDKLRRGWRYDVVGQEILSLLGEEQEVVSEATGSPTTSSSISAKL